jgi:hypothetical protein
MTNTQGAANRSAAGAPPAATPGGRLERDLDAWKQFLRTEDTRLDEVRVAAALVTVGLARAADVVGAVSVLEGALRPTDRIGLLCDDELSVLLAPLSGIHEAQHLVQVVASALDAAAVDAHVGWSMRQPGHGLFHALARADAAMLTAKGHGRIALDLGARERPSPGT